MANGRGGAGVPDPEDDIPIYEGEGGGPAGPAGGSAFPAAEKEMFGAIGDTLAIGAAIGGVATAIAAGTGVGAPAAAGMGVVVAVTGFLAVAVGAISKDPPKPFERIVRFKRRVFQYAPPKTELERRAFVVAQQAMFASITARGLLDAAERRDGAIQGGDIDWAIAHDSVARTAAATFRVDLATTAVALLRLADEIKGTDLDVEIDAKRIDAFKAWFANPENRDHLHKTLVQNGVAPAEVDEALALVTSDETSKALAGRTSEMLQARATSLYDAAVALKLRRIGAVPASRLPTTS